ncbi:MAG: Alpha-aspartyl dipeptidase Peptidase [Gemmatimonadetes bacterium]|nr:Alpha-aspartyl dipeptidase Peptidase [Gemmatimonadota bacterium]
MTRRLLLLSSSRDANGVYLLHSSSAIRSLLGESVRHVLFIPYAGVTIAHDAYAERAAVPFAKLGYDLQSIGDASNPADAVESAEAIVVGGGNTFQLLATLQDRKLLEVIRTRVRAGVPYIGWSAGAVITAPTIGTTNDMPIVEPESLRALGLIPFQINAHYTDQHPPGHQGETRAERLEEYVAVNRTTRVLGLREGCSLRIFDDAIALNGVGTAPVFQYGASRAEYSAGDDISFLLAA